MQIMFLCVAFLLATLVMADFDTSGLGARSTQCDNPFVKSGEADTFVCGNSSLPFLDMIPKSTLNVTFAVGPKTAACFALLCAYRALGCGDEMMRVQATIKNAGGTVGSTCPTDFGLGANTCELAGNFVYQQDYPQITNPLNYTAIALKFSLCNPTLATLAQALAGSNATLKAIADGLGPCGAFCRQASCGLALLCPMEAPRAVQAINQFRAICTGDLMLPFECGSDDVQTSSSGGTRAPTESTSSSSSSGSGGQTVASEFRAEVCAAQSNTSCAMCTSQYEFCMWCASSRRCFATSKGYLGPSDSVASNLFGGDSAFCSDWQYSQCWMSGRLLLLVPTIVVVALVVCIAVTVTACCVCRMLKKKKQQRKGYKLQADDGHDDVALLGQDDLLEKD